MSHRHGSSHLDADARQESLHVSGTLRYFILYVTGHRLACMTSLVDYGGTVPHEGACRGVQITPKLKQG